MNIFIRLNINELISRSKVDKSATAKNFPTLLQHSIKKPPGTPTVFFNRVELC